eukprot:Skav202192  [mRNA]  locus=scaffold191:13755:17530:- [translate_table: standard]
MTELKANLEQLPLLAMLLPSDTDDKAVEIFQRLSMKGLKVEVTAHTSYLHQPRTLWVLGWKVKIAHTPAGHLTNIVNIISEETQHLRPKYGPWLWPLHDRGVTSAISLSEVADPHAKCWRKLLWAVRLLPPEHGSILEKCVTEHYGRETAYIFHWANLFTRGLWVMSLPMLIFGVCSVKPSNIGVDSLAWYILQVLTILWGLGITVFGCSRQAVLRSGSGVKALMVAADKRIVLPAAPAKEETTEAADPEGGIGGIIPGQVGDEPKDVPPKVDSSGDQMKSDQDGNKGPMTAPASSNRKWAMRKKQPEIERNSQLDSKKLAALAGAAASANSDSGDGTPAEDVTDYSKDCNLNPEYNPDHVSCKRKAWATLVTTISLAVFLCAATLVLSLVLQLKSYIIFEWGECIKLKCDNAGQKWGFSAVLVDIAVDILLALVFIVALGEACKAISFQLARVWNFRLMRNRQKFQALVDLCIEVMAKVGVFVILGFVFLPSWSESSVEGSSQLPEEACATYIDYEVCRSIFGCDGSNPYCCSGTLSCARQMLPFSARRGLFENWLAGPFIVAPFVDLIPAVLAPMLADRLADLADEGATSRAGRCCCFACGWLARFLAFIFILDGEVTGLRYVCLGKTFRETTIEKLTLQESPEAPSEDHPEGKEEDMEAVEGALEQVTERELIAMDEIKELKLNFLFVLLFAPLKPLLVLPTLLARVIEVRAKLQKVFLIRRRNVPRDARLIHGPQEAFIVFSLIISCFWHFGLVFMAYNTELPSWSFGSVLGVWLGGGAALATVLFLIYREADRRAWALLFV